MASVEFAGNVAVHIFSSILDMLEIEDFVLPFCLLKSTS